MKLQRIVSMEGPFETLERQADHAHSDATSLREACAANCKADAKLGSSTKDCPWGLAGGLETSNLRGNFTGLREIFLFRLLGEERILLGPGGPRTGEVTDTYSTSHSSTTSEILTPSLVAVSL